MTRKDYQLIADSLRRSRAWFSVPPQTDTYRLWERLMLELCGELARDNPRFDRAKFIAACKR